MHDTKGIVPVLRQLAGGGFQGPAIGDLGYRGERLAKAAEALGITVRPIARGRDGVFIPTEIAWVVERSFSWISRYRRLNIIVERTKGHLVAFVQIAFISILSRRLQRLAPQKVSVCSLRTASEVRHSLAPSDVQPFRRLPANFATEPRAGRPHHPSKTLGSHRAISGKMTSSNAISSMVTTNGREP